MSHIRVSIVIDAPPETVWRDIEDIASHVSWMADAEAIRITSSSRSGTGTTFDCETRIGPLRLTDRMRITEWDPPATMGVEHTGAVTGVGRFTLRPVGRGRTEFTWDELLTFPLWFGSGVGARVAAPVLERVWRRNLEALKARIEDAATTRARSPR